MRAQLELELERKRELGWGKLIDAVSRLLNGERDEEVLCQGLDPADTLIVRTSLAVIENCKLLRSVFEEPPRA